jgi:hypothetical protein
MLPASKALCFLAALLVVLASIPAGGRNGLLPSVPTLGSDSRSNAPRPEVAADASESVEGLASSAIFDGNEAWLPGSSLAERQTSFHEVKGKPLC